MRRWLSHRLHMWAARLHDDWHHTTLTHTDGSKVSFGCYWQWTGSWPDTYEFDCDCEETP
jgi:hypothetical protein